MAFSLAHDRATCLGPLSLTFLVTNSYLLFLDFLDSRGLVTR
jgi:hypothetical protein